MNKINYNMPQKGYNKVTLYDEKAKKSKVYFVPVGQQLTVNGNTYKINK